MEWAEAISKAVEYIEAHITEDITVQDISNEVYISPFYFQKGFSLLCGFTISEYIRNRRLSLAGNELATSAKKVIDIALKYGYDSPDSFTKAFTRFHGVTPSMVQKDEHLLKTFAPLKIKLSMEGGYIMDYKIEKKDTFEYLIADMYNPVKEVPEGFITKTIPAFTWAEFPCRGAMPDALQYVNTKIFSEWLPALRDYEFAAGYCVEMYDDASKYPNGTQDENYYCEIWIPVKEK